MHISLSNAAFLLLMRNKYQQRIQHYKRQCTVISSPQHLTTDIQTTVTTIFVQKKMANVDKPMPPIENTPKHPFQEKKNRQT